MLAPCSTLNLVTVYTRLHLISIFLHSFVPSFNLEHHYYFWGAIDEEGYTPKKYIDSKAASNYPEYFFLFFVSV